MNAPIDATKIKEAIARDVLNLFVKCDEYARLLGKDSKNVETLNKAASKFFQVYQMVIWADLVIDLSRITGPKSTGRGARLSENLTILRLPDLVDPIFRDEVTEKVNDAVQKSSFVLEARNKIFAHRDLSVALSSNAGGIRRGNVDEMCDAVWAVKEAVEAALPGQVGWRSTRFPGGADDLVNLLEFALKQKDKA